MDSVGGAFLTQNVSDFLSRYVVLRKRLHRKSKSILNV
jgi:hypothetical protein